MANPKSCPQHEGGHRATTGEVTDHRKPMRVEDATPEQLIAGIVEMCDTDLTVTVLRFRGTGARRYSLPTV